MARMPQSEPKKISIELLIQDYTMYPRSQVDSTTVNRYIDALKSGAVMPPIRVDFKTKRIIDGFHRVFAHQRLGLKTIDAYLEKTRGEADFYRRAISANSIHGRPYCKWDHKRILARAKELGIEEKIIADSLRLPLDRLHKLQWEGGLSSTGKAISLKTTVKHMAGRTLTPYQEEVNQSLGGMRPSHYVNTLYKLLDADLIDWENTTLVVLLNQLSGLLTAKIEQNSEQVASALHRSKQK
jgi:hypothetical protein